MVTGIYEGQTVPIDFLKGGWNANPNTDLLPPEAMIEALNINLHRGGRETRGGVAKVNGTPISGSPQIMGEFQFRKKNGNTFIIAYTAGGKIVKDYTTELKTGLTASVYPSFAVFEDKLYICNGADRPQVWDGVAASTSDLTNIPTDWTGTNWPKYVLKHGRGVSERLWAFGCPNNLETVYASANGTDDFSDVNVVTLEIETEDGFGLVGGFEFGDRLFVMGKSKPYLIDDEAVSVASWGYVAGQWEGGVAHHRLIAKTPTDVICMDENGEIYSVLTTQTYGDYRANSLTQPAYINRWIRDNIDLSQIDKFHMVWDPILRAIKVFMVRNGQTQVDTALVYFIDRGPLDGWVRHLYSKTTFGSCSALVRVGVGNWNVYTGGYDGTIYKLEQSATNDDGLYFYNGFTTPYLAMGNPRITKRYDRAHLVIKPQSGETIKTHLFADGNVVSGGFLFVNEGGDYLGNESGDIFAGIELEEWSVLASTTFRQDLQNVSHPIGIIANRVRAEVFNNTINEKFFISQLLIDYTPLGSRPN